MKYIKEYIDFSQIDEYETTDINGIEVVNLTSQEAFDVFFNHNDNVCGNTPFTYNCEYSIYIDNRNKWLCFYNEIIKHNDYTIEWTSGLNADEDDIYRLETTYGFSLSDTPIYIYMSDDVYTDTNKFKIFFRRKNNGYLKTSKIINIIC
jgi:hypothetical protein